MFQVSQMFFVSRSVSQWRANLHLPHWRQNQNMERRHQPKATESDYKAGEGAAHVETSTAAHLEIASTQTHEWNCFQTVYAKQFRLYKLHPRLEQQISER